MRSYLRWRVDRTKNIFIYKFPPAKKENLEGEQNMLFCLTDCVPHKPVFLLRNFFDKNKMRTISELNFNCLLWAVYVQVRVRAGGYIEEVQHAVRNTGTRSILIMPVSIFWFSPSFRKFKSVFEMHEISIRRECLNSSRHFIPTYVQVAAHVLGQPEKAFWKNCVLEEKEEIELAEKFRDAFEPFDFSL